jgi:hypothetical protein
MIGQGLFVFNCLVGTEKMGHWAMGSKSLCKIKADSTGKHYREG